MEILKNKLNILIIFDELIVFWITKRKFLILCVRPNIYMKKFLIVCSFFEEI